MTVWIWSLGEGGEIGQVIALNPGATDCESRVRVDLEVKSKWFPFHLVWMALPQLRASKGTLRITGSYPIRGRGKLVSGSGGQVEKEGEKGREEASIF